MKANETPMKIYINSNLENRIWLIGKGDTSFIEYIRTDAFIEKACEWIKTHVEYYIKSDKTCNIPMCPQFNKIDFIEEFKKAMNL